jgi:pimeloyl-ACP methyl ester carboxylesterase
MAWRAGCSRRAAMQHFPMVMQRAELQAAGQLAGDAIGGFGGLIADMHEAVAGRVFRALGPMGAPVRVVHDGVSGEIHRGVRAGLRALPRGGAQLAALNAGPDTLALGDTPRGGVALAVLNGAIGDALAEADSTLALGMTVRRDGGDVGLDADELALTFPEATPRVAVFVHGLIESEDAWVRPPLSGRRPPRPSYGALLRDDLAYTPVYVRYNTGRHISDSGRALSELLEALVASWPVDVQELALVGHSMGGLVARSATHLGELDGCGWVVPLRHVVCLGSPHMGAPLEKAANVAGWTLGRLPETRPFAKVINGRSVGIKDLRFGSCAEADWCDCDADDLLTDRCNDVPFVDHAAYYFIGATLFRDEPDPVGHVLGDLLVRLPSASGRGRRRAIPFDVDRGRHLPGLNHFDLLNHPQVYDQLRDWLKAEPEQLATND